MKACLLLTVVNHRVILVNTVVYFFMLHYFTIMSLFHIIGHN